MGFAIVAGGNPNMAVPVAGIAASTLAVGSTVKLMESGAAVEYLVVNQGIPSNSNLYDASCDGTWLLRKDIHSDRVWNSSNVSTYASSAINTWLNGDFFNTLATGNAVKQVKIPYCTGGGTSTVNSGANGLSVRAFLLGGYELGLRTSDNSSFPVDGAKLSYFDTGMGTSANNKRIANLNGAASVWGLRSPWKNDTNFVWDIDSNGEILYGVATGTYGIRPALVLSKTAIFDRDTMILKGAA